MTSGPIEKKVAYPAAAMTAATVALGFIHYYAPQWQLPPVWLVSAALTVVWSVVGYFAPHTHLRPDPGAIDVAALNQPAARAQNRTFGAAGTVTDVPVVRVQPSATGNGPQKGTTP